MRGMRMKQGMLGVLSLALAVGTSLLPGTGTAAAAESTAGGVSGTGTSGAGSARTITILHTNDIHSRVEEAKDASIGYAKLATLVQNYRKANPDTLVLDAGDTFHGQTIANLVRGESVLNIMNLIGYDAMAPGNHDFNYGSGRLVELSKLAKFPIVSANVKRADGTRLLEPYVIKEVGGVKVGIFGLTTPETAFKTHPKNVEGISFTDPAAEAKAIVAELKDKTDVIIGLAHLGVDGSSVDTSEKVALAVPEIDVIIDGHSHTTMETGREVGGVLIAQTGEYLKNIGRVELTLENGKVSGKKAGLLTKAVVEADKTAADPAVTELVSSIKKEQEAVLSEQVGTTSVKLEGDREVVRRGESNLGNLITDAMLAETGADVAITNGGGIRASIEAGTITKGQVVTVLPFGNYIQTKKVKGADIRAALELGVGSYPDTAGGFPQVGGMTFEFDASLPKGSRVTAVYVKGQPLAADADYLLATNDFMAAGGDSYTMFKNHPIVNDFSSLEESLITHLQQLGTVQPQVEGRIRATGAAAPAPAPATQPAPPAASVGIPPGAPSSAAGLAEKQQAGKLHIVQPGDSLWKIARKNGVTWQQLQQLNGLLNPNLIFPGQQIILP